jgi:hypothetical protein
MFSYNDPTGLQFLNNPAATEIYRTTVDAGYDQAARENACAFTWLEAFQEASPADVQVARVDWLAFPRLSTATNEQIDANRFTEQEEYIEWRVEKGQGQVTRVTFTTEFTEYLGAFAAAGEVALVAAIQQLIPGANPTTAEIFGPGPVVAGQSPRARAKRFVDQLARNPWNDGRKGILCLTHGANTLGALFGLLRACGVEKTEGSEDDTCGLVGGACVPGRESDPRVCRTAQSAVRAQQCFSLADPAGIFISELQGDWRLNNQPLDINNPATNQGVWKVSRKWPSA